MASDARAARREARLWLLQRGSAVVLGFAVLVHLATILYAVRGGLTAAEILARTRGNDVWLAFYLLFLAAIAVHVPIGLRAIARDWTSWRHGLDPACLALGLALFALGLRAILGLYR
jgi:fumarate reductase subunit C